MESLCNFLKSIQDAGIVIDTVYDIGAMYGHWTELCQQYIPNANFLLFEANPECIHQLMQTRRPFYNFVLSNPDRTSVAYYAGGLSSGNSYYKENTNFYDSCKVYHLPTITLDNLIERYSLPLPDFIKLDTQGSELDILAGAERAISHAKLILTECPIVQYNQGAPNIHDYLEYFRKKGFVPAQLIEHHVVGGILVQIDIIFMQREVYSRLTNDNIIVQINYN